MNKPWLWQWNHSLFEVLFRYLPIRPNSVDWCEELIANPLLSTWIFAASFYHYWTKNDERKTWRRARLLQPVVALGFSVLVTLILRPWIHWPAPSLSPEFQALFPRYLWGSGNENCFPSHSTLAYVTLALGFYPLNQRLSVGLTIATLVLISFPRIYMGGHYPVDVVFSFLLALASLLICRRWQFPESLEKWAINDDSASIVQTGLLFFGIFEVGEGFHSVDLLISAVRHWWFGIH
jgi:undecaprenyl-diphosphatase